MPKILGGEQPLSGALNWRHVIDPTERAKLTPAANGQAQIDAASHLVVFAAKTNFSEAGADTRLKNLSKIRSASLETLAPLRGMLVGTVVHGLDETARNAWARDEAYIALGNLVNSAALPGIDVFPMEGFDRAQYNEIPGLKAQVLTSAVMAILGYRLPTDKMCGCGQVALPERRGAGRDHFVFANKPKSRCASPPSENNHHRCQACARLVPPQTFKSARGSPRTISKGN